jgi:hypothetical protein
VAKKTKPTKKPAAVPTTESTEQRASREAWAKLGELLGAALVAAERELAGRFAMTIRTRLQFFPGADKALRKAIDKALAGPCETDEIVKSFGYWAESRDFTIARSLVGSWTALTEQPEFDPTSAWRMFEEELRERAVDDLDKGLRDAAGVRGVEDDLARLREDPLVMWPLEPAGDLRERVRAWRDAAVERGLPMHELVDPNTLRSMTTFSWQPAPLAAHNLSTWLDDRAAWSRAIALVLPLLPR